MGGCTSKPDVIVSPKRGTERPLPPAEETPPVASTSGKNHATPEKGKPAKLHAAAYNGDGKHHSAGPGSDALHPAVYGGSTNKAAMSLDTAVEGGATHAMGHPPKGGSTYGGAGGAGGAGGQDLSRMSRADRRTSNMQILRRDSVRLSRTSSFQTVGQPGHRGKQHRMAFDQAKLQESLLTDAANVRKNFVELEKAMSDAYAMAEALMRGAKPTTLTEEETDLIHAGMQRCVLFSDIQRDEVPHVLGILTRETLPPGTVLMKQDDKIESSSKAYLLLSGSCDVFAEGDNEEIRKRAGSHGTESDAGRYGVKVGVVRPYQFFGDYAIVTETGRSATVVVAEEAVVLGVSKPLALTLGFKFSLRMQVLKYLLSLAVFNSVSTPVLFNLLESVEVVEIEEGTTFRPVGQPFLYLVMRGGMGAGQLPGRRNGGASEGDRPRPSDVSIYSDGTSGGGYNRRSSGVAAPPAHILKPGSVLGPGPFGTQDAIYETFTATAPSALIKCPRDQLYRLLPPLSALMLDYEVLLSTLEVPGVQTACRKVKDILGSVSVERYDEGSVVREKGDPIEELVMLRCGTIAPVAEEGVGEEEREEAFKGITYQLPGGTTYLGQWSQFDTKRPKMPVSVRAASECVIVVTIKHTTLRRLAERYLMEDVSSSHANLLAALRMVLHEELHQFLTPLRLGEVLAIMKPFFESRGSKLADRGRTIRELRILISGAAQIVSQLDTRPKLLCQFEAIGSEYLDGSQRFTTDVVVTSQTVEGLAIAWADLEALAGRTLCGVSGKGPSEESLTVQPSLPSHHAKSRPGEEGEGEDEEDATNVTSIFEIGKNTSQIDLADIQVRVLLGYGFAGEVYLVHDNRTEKPAALKVIRKERLVDVKMVEHVLNEINIMVAINSPMVCRLYGTYQDAEALYLFMEFISGPEMMMVLETVNKFSPEQTRFYIANVLLGLKALHDAGVAHRDIKPENIVFDEFGYAKLVDMGLAKKIKAGQKAWTVCGTPAYQAPEVHTGQGCTVLVDIWCLGVLAYELVTGTNPFGVVDSPDIWWKTVQKIDSGRFIIPVTEPLAHDFIKQCLVVSPDRRPRIEDLMRHPWMEGTDWEGMVARRVKAPFAPNREDFGSGPWDSMYLNPDGTRPEPLGGEGYVEAVEGY